MNTDRTFDPARQARITEVKNTKVTLHNALALWEEIGELEQYAVSAATQRRLMSVRRRAGLLLAKYATHIWDCPKRTIANAFCICGK